MTIGVLALQGDFAEHQAMLLALGVDVCLVRSVQDLQGIAGVILPGGESTVQSRLLDTSGLRGPLTERIADGMPVFGTCAGAILLATDVVDAQGVQPLGILHMQIARNAYGTQLQSFTADIAIHSQKTPLIVAFIRAPQILSVGKEVEVLASHEDTPVLVRHGSVMAATFHPEVRGEKALHALWLEYLR